jgi:hypothetical protein
LSGRGRAERLLQVLLFHLSLYLQHHQEDL